VVGCSRHCRSKKNLCRFLSVGWLV